MGPSGVERPHTNAGRAPTWEKARRSPYVTILIIALLLSIVCLSLWRRERSEAEITIIAALTASAGEVIPGAAEDITATCRLHGERWRSFIEEIDLITINDYDDEDIARLSNSLFNDPGILRAWIILEPSDERGKPAYAVMSERGAGKREQGFAGDIMRGEYYSAARKRNSARVRPVVQNEVESSTVGFFGYTVKQTLTLLADGPVTSGGHLAGVAGFEVDIQDIFDMIYGVSYESELDLFLIDPDGNLAASSRGAFIDEHYRDIPQRGYPDALMACAGKIMAGGGFDTILSGRGAARTFAAFAPVDVGDGGPRWFLAALSDMGAVHRAGKSWLMALFFVWIAAISAMLAIYEIRSRKAAKAETKQALALMSPEVAEIFKKLEFRRKVCCVLCAFFCIPAMLFLNRADKRYQEAKRAADAEAAVKAVAGMTPVAAVSVVIGSVALYLNIIYR